MGAHWHPGSLIRGRGLGRRHRGARHARVGRTMREEGAPRGRSSGTGRPPTPPLEPRDRGARMEETDTAPISVAGLTNFGNTCYANALLQALSSCPSLLDHVRTVERATAAGLGRHMAQGAAPLVHALSNALIRLQPQPGCQDLTGSASSLAVLHAMVGRGVEAFCPMGAQQDVCVALEELLSAVQKETDSFLHGQRRPLTFSSRLHRRIKTIIDCPTWNPALDVPIVRNTAAGGRSLTPDDMGDLQMRLSREQGPCNGLLAECTVCECGYTHAVEFTAFASLSLPLPMVAEDGEVRVRPGACLQDCLRAYCETREAGPLDCPRCHLRATVDGAFTRRGGLVGGEPYSDSEETSCDEPRRAAAQGWFGRMLGWMGWESGTEAEEGAVDSESSRTSVCSAGVGHGKGLSDSMSDDSEGLSSRGSFPCLLSGPSCRQSFSAWSVAEAEPVLLNAHREAFDPLQAQGSKSLCSFAGCGRAPTSTTSRGSPTPSCTSSWGGWLGAYGSNGVCLEGSLVSDLISKVRVTLGSEAGLGSKVVQLKEVEGVGMQWRGKSSTATATMKVGRLPQVLPIHLEREVLAEGVSRKVAGGLDVPVMLDMSEFVHMPQARGSFYHLVAMVIRVGDRDDGHYLTARRAFLSDTDSVWFLASDEHVQQVAEEDVLCLPPTMLLYERGSAV